MGTTGDAGLIIGVDTHLDTHTAAACDQHGRAESRLQIPATSAGMTAGYGHPPRRSSLEPGKVTIKGGACGTGTS